MNEHDRLPSVEEPARLAWIDGLRPVAELLVRFLGAEGHFLCDGMRQPIPVSIARTSARLEGHVGPQTLLAVRPLLSEVVLAPWVTGGHITLWLTDDIGLVAFRVPALGASDGALLVSPPATLLRLTRRAEPRYVVPEGGEAAVTAALSQGPDWVPVKLLDISASGLQIEVPADPHLAVRQVVSLRLTLGARPFEVSALVCRLIRDKGTLRAGLQIASIGKLERIVLERLVARHGETAPAERYAAPTLSPQIRAGLLSPQMRSLLPPSLHPEDLPAAVLLRPA